MVISLYFHIPFCKRKCDYCHFYVLPNEKRFHEQLLSALDIEWQLRLPLIADKKVVSLYFGGGTPALLAPDSIALLIEKAKPYLTPDAEITIEANPEDVTPSLMKSFAQAGINRVSLGVQSLDDDLLKLLSRNHSAEQAKRAVIDTYQSDIENISIDLMYDLPNQTMTHWKNTLSQANQLPITHLSLYNLTIEPHTVFYKKKNLLTPLLPDPELSAEMYQFATQSLSSFKQYEISAFCKNNLFSRHNIGYWTGRPFLGFGPSAFSYWDHKRFRNIANLNKYAQLLASGNSPVDFEEELDPIARQKELLAIGLRLTEGIRPSTLPAETLETIDQLIQQGFIIRNNETLHLTPKGILFYDTVATDLV